MTEIIAITLAGIAIAASVYALHLAKRVEGKIDEMVSERNKPRTLFTKDKWQVVSRLKDGRVTYYILEDGVEVFRNHSKYNTFQNLKSRTDV